MRPAPKITRSESRLVFGFFALVFFAYTFVYPYIAAVNNPNENVRTYMTMAIVEGHTFRIDDIVARHGWVNDMARAPEKRMKPIEVPVYCMAHAAECHLYSVKAPAVSYLGVPVYWALTKVSKPPALDAKPEVRAAWLEKSTFVLRLFCVQIPCFVFLVAVEKWLRRASRDVVLRLSAVAAIGLGTNYLAYALMFASHSLFGVAAFSSFAITTAARMQKDPKRRRWRDAFWAGFFAGFATLLEYHALPVSVVLALYALTTFYRPTRLLSFALGGTVNALALMFFQWRAFSDPLMPGHKMSENQAYAQLLSQGLFGIGTPSGQVALDISFSKAFGFFGTSSFMWLGVLALPVPWIFLHLGAVGLRRDRQKRLLPLVFSALAMAALWVTVSAAINWRGGWTVGPRYLGAAPPFFAFGALLALEILSGRSPFKRAIARAAATGLALASLFQSGLVSSLYNTVPESVTRPLPQFVVPLFRTAFAPHHLLEAVGVESPAVYFFVVWCMLTAVAIVMIWRTRRERARHYALRLGLSLLFLGAGVSPALSAPAPDEGGDAGLAARRDLTIGWEPAGRDRITRLREVAERYGDRGPCLWLRLAELDRIVSHEAAAVADERHARGTRPDACR